MRPTPPRISTIPPPTFRTSVNAIVQRTDSLRNLSLSMQFPSAGGGIPTEMASLLDLGGRVFRTTISMAPSRHGLHDRADEIAAIEAGFEAERSYLQDLVDKHVTTEPMVGIRSNLMGTDAARFLCRLSSITNEPIEALLFATDRIEMTHRLDKLRKMGSRQTFGELDMAARRAFKGERALAGDEHGDSAEVAERLFKQGFIYSALTDGSADSTVERRFMGAAELYAREGFFGAAAICLDLASRAWDSMISIEKDRAGMNPHPRTVANYLLKSLVHDEDMDTFGERYLYGLHYAKRSANHLAMQNLFGASVAFYKARGIPRETARAHLRKTWAFSHRQDGVTASDWKQTSADLKEAASIFDDSWVHSDQETVPALKSLSQEALRLGGWAR